MRVPADQYEYQISFLEASRLKRRMTAAIGTCEAYPVQWPIGWPSVPLFPYQRFLIRRLFVYGKLSDLSIAMACGNNPKIWPNSRIFAWSLRPWASVTYKQTDIDQ